MNRTLLCISVLLFLPSPAFATSGWDGHDTQVAGYRIHGANGSSFVHRVGSDTRPELALCSSLDANGQFVGAIGPPDFAVTNSHLAVRYPVLSSAESQPIHFLIRIRDGQVTGPLAVAEFVKLPVVSGARLRWKTPLTAADEFGRFFVIVIVGLLLLSLAFAIGIARRLRNYLLRVDGSEADVEPKKKDD